jgi:hypothetical protein
MVDRNTITHTVVCDNCGREYDNKIEWLENDPCMPERV